MAYSLTQRCFLTFLRRWGSTMSDRFFSRRGIVSAAAASASVGVAGISVLAAERSDAQLLDLGAQLEAVHAERAVFDARDPYSDDLTLYERHWQLREAINRMSASTFAGLQVKAKAAQMALHHDPRSECEGDGSFLGLSNSLTDDILAMTGGPDASRSNRQEI